MPLPAANRLPLRKERDRLTKEGKTFYSRHFTLVTAPSPISVIPGSTRNPDSESSVARFSILLSKKTARLAVNRNLIKRRTSALLAELLPSFPMSDYLIIPKRTVLDAPHSELLSDLSSLPRQLKATAGLLSKLT